MIDLVRTFFEDDSAWDLFVEKLEAWSEEEFFVVSDAGNKGISCQQLRKQIADKYRERIVCVADEKTVSDPEHPVLVSIIDRKPAREFRVALNQLGAMVASFDRDGLRPFYYFASCDEDGVFREMPETRAAYEPICSIASLQEPQSKLRSKIGGLPWGLPKKYWNDKLALLAQLVHEPPMVDLGGDYVLHLWHWSTPDDYCDPPLYEESELWATLVPVAEMTETSFTEPPAGVTPFEELYIDSWREFDQQQTLGRLYGGPETRVAGLPGGGGHSNPEDDLPLGMSFLFQTDGTFVLGAPPSVDTDMERTSIAELEKSLGVEPRLAGQERKYSGTLMKNGKGIWRAYIADFASDGNAWVFIDRAADPPKVVWNWSR